MIGFASLSWLSTALRGCKGYHADTVVGSRRDVKSESELRRFFLGKGGGLDGVFSPILLSVLVLRWELPGQDLGSSEEPEVVGRSLEAGREGGSIRLSESVDLDLTRETFGILLLPGLFAFLLNVRQIDATFDSGSFLLFSRLKVLKPNRFRSDDAFELIDPVLKDRVLDNEPVPGAMSSFSRPVKAESKRLS